jgi:hypothetical protein
MKFWATSSWLRRVVGVGDRQLGLWPGCTSACWQLCRPAAPATGRVVHAGRRHANPSWVDPAGHLGPAASRSGASAACPPPVRHQCRDFTVSTRATSTAGRRAGAAAAPERAGGGALPGPPEVVSAPSCHAPVGQRVGALVALMPGVAAHPVPLNAVTALGDQRIELLPQVDIFHRLLGRGAPAPGLPAGHPFGDALAHVLAVQVQVDLARALEGLQASITAVSSMRLLVVSGSPPNNSFSRPGARSSTPQPPGPGLPLQAPSVYISMRFMVFLAASACQSSAASY